MGLNEIEIWALSGPTLLTIAGMAGATWLTRVSGYLVGRWMRFGPRSKAALEAMPPAILTAIIAPMVLTEGIAEAAAAVVTVLAAMRLPTMAAVALGVAAVAGLRALGL